jgi:hypothetical protein
VSVDQFLDRQYDRANYNCAHLVCEAWEAETGQALGDVLQGFLLPPRARHVDWSKRHALKRLDSPQSPCIVLMRRPRLSAHVGMFVRGKVLHINEAGVAFQRLSIATLGFPIVGFYGYANCNYRA